MSQELLLKLFKTFVNKVCIEATYEGIEYITKENEASFYITYLHKHGILLKDHYMCESALDYELDTFLNSENSLCSAQCGYGILILYMFHKDVHGFYIREKWQSYAWELHRWYLTNFNNRNLPRLVPCKTFDELRSYVNSRNACDYLLGVHNIQGRNWLSDVCSIFDEDKIHILLGDRVATITLSTENWYWRQYGLKILKFKKLFDDTYFVIFVDDFDYGSIVLSEGTMATDNSWYFTGESTFDGISEKAFKRLLVSKGVF